MFQKTKGDCLFLDTININFINCTYSLIFLTCFRQTYKFGNVMIVKGREFANVVYDFNIFFYKS